MKLAIHPATPERWCDVEAVFGARGCSQARGCWCMAYRYSGAGPAPARGQRQADARRAALKALVDAGEVPGLVAYRAGEPVGWVSLAPRQAFARLQRSPVMKPVDDTPVWSVICFVVPSAHRGQGVAGELLAGAVRHARRRGARMLEAYPMDKAGRSADENMWFGTRTMFERAGFVEVARRKPERPILRLALTSRA